MDRYLLIYLFIYTFTRIYVEQFSFVYYIHVRTHSIIYTIIIVSMYSTVHIWTLSCIMNTNLAHAHAHAHAHIALWTWECCIRCIRCIHSCYIPWNDTPLILLHRIERFVLFSLFLSFEFWQYNIHCIFITGYCHRLTNNIWASAALQFYVCLFGPSF